MTVLLKGSTTLVAEPADPGEHDQHAVAGHRRDRDVLSGISGTLLAAGLAYDAGSVAFSPWPGRRKAAEGADRGASMWPSLPDVLIRHLHAAQMSMSSGFVTPAGARVDLSAIRHNAALSKEAAGGAELMAAVKADAYSLIWSVRGAAGGWGVEPGGRHDPGGHGSALTHQPLSSPCSPRKNSANYPGRNTREDVGAGRPPDRSTVAQCGRCLPVPHSWAAAVLRGVTTARQAKALHRAGPARG